MEHRVATFLLVAATALLAIEANADSSRINSISNSISSSHGSSGSLSVEGVCVVDDSNGNEAGCSSDTSTVSYAVDPHELLPHEQNWPLNRGWDPSLDACDEGIDVRPALTIEEVCTQRALPPSLRPLLTMSLPSSLPSFDASSRADALLCSRHHHQHQQATASLQSPCKDMCCWSVTRVCQ